MSIYFYLCVFPSHLVPSISLLLSGFVKAADTTYIQYDVAGVRKTEQTMAGNIHMS